MKNLNRSFTMDSSGIIHMAAIRPHHSNSFRISFTFIETIDPEILQQAVDFVTPRFPSVVAAIKPGAKQYQVVPVSQPPKVKPGTQEFRCLTKEEIDTCAIRILHEDRTLHLDMFHSITDGTGGMTFLVSLSAEYLRRRYGIDIPFGYPVLDPSEEPALEELADDYITFAGEKPAKADNARVWQLPGEAHPEEGIKATPLTYPAASILAAAKHYNASMTAFLTVVMMEAIANMQAEREDKSSPLQIAVPADARRIFNSRTLRNFSALAYPRMDPHEFNLPFAERIAIIKRQFEANFNKAAVEALMCTYTKAQHSALVECVPLSIKVRIARLVHMICGARNSCMTLSNLGVIDLPASMTPYITDMRALITPRILSPYNFIMLTYQGTCYLTVTRFCQEDELSRHFVECLEKYMSEAAK